MSDTDVFDPEDYEGVQPKMAQIPRTQVRKWEKQAKELEELRTQAARANREIGFVKAGIPDDGLGKLFRKAYDGPDDVDAIKAAATEYGVLKPEGQAQVDASLAGHQTAIEAVSGAPPAAPGDDIEARMRQAKSAQEVARIAQEAGLNQFIPTATRR